MDRKDFYFRELVTEDDMNAAWNNAENADRDTLIDATMVQKVDGTNAPLSTPAGTDFNALLGGIVSGLNVTISGTNATVTTGTAYDSAGQRIHTPGSLTVSLATTGTTSIGAGGTPGGVGSISTTPASGQFIWILLQIFFNRLLSDPREDGNDAIVYFNEAESFQFSVKCSVSSATPTIPGGDPGCIILGAFKIDHTNTITTEDYSTRGDWLRTFATYSASPLPSAQKEDGTTTDVNFIAGSIRQAILKLRNTIGLSTTNYNNHISQSAPQDRHAAKNIDFDATSAIWADGTSPAIGAINGGGIDTDGVQAAINTLITNIADTTTGFGGSKYLGGASITGSPVTIAAGTIRSQIATVLAGLNSHLNAVTGAHAALAISATPGTTLLSNTVAGQLAALDIYLTNRIGSATSGTFTQNSWIYTTALGKPTSGFDHWGFAAGKVLEYQETWLNAALTPKSTLGSGPFFGAWNYGLFGATPLFAQLGGSTLGTSVAVRGPQLILQASTNGSDGAAVVEGSNSYFCSATGIYGMEFDFSISGGSSIKSDSTFALGFCNLGVVSSTSASPINGGSATFSGAYLTINPGDTTWTFQLRNSTLSTSGGSNTGVAVATNTVYRAKIVIAPGSVNDNTTNSVYVWLSTGSSSNLVLTITVGIANMAGLFMTPFFRCSSHSGETNALSVGPVRMFGHINDSSAFI